ncbi:hypothetical protein DERP_002287 [Dermatophagoides pteronyssinus]|uniref:Uncharacterized protein n=1 Tax=Dermatophagoides pteronyssinus TaxID=6956 RepID=A0ABQ8JHQ3_DERPT|nr:hypothetical protein DERP_002287 [Dermatophagoides pteronyssinus]
MHTKQTELEKKKLLTLVILLVSCQRSQMLSASPETKKERNSTLNSNNFHHLIIWALTTTTNSDGHQSMIQNRQLTYRYIVCSPCNQYEIYGNFNLSFKPEGLLCDCQLEDYHQSTTTTTNSKFNSKSVTFSSQLTTTYQELWNEKHA